MHTNYLTARLKTPYYEVGILITLGDRDYSVGFMINSVGFTKVGLNARKEGYFLKFIFKYNSCQSLLFWLQFFFFFSIGWVHLIKN